MITIHWPYFQYWNAFIISLSHIIYGLHAAWPNSFVRELEKNTTNSTSSDQSWIISALSFGEIAAPILAALSGNIIGRRTILIVTTIPTIAASLLFVLSNKAIYLIVGRALIGFFMGWGCTIAPMFIGETSSPLIRGKLLTLLTIQLNFGLFLGFVISGIFTYYTYNVILVITPIIFFVLTFSTIESPYYQLMKNNESNGIKSLKKLRLSNNVSNDLITIQSFIKEQRSEKVSLLNELTNRTNIIACLLGMGYQMTNVSSGIDIFVSYLIVIIQAAEITLISPTVISMIFSGAGVVMIAVTSFLIDLWGRKTLLVLSSTFSSVFLCGLGIYFYLIFINSPLLQSIQFVPIICLIMYKVSIGIGLASLLRICIGELFSTRFAPIGACICRSFYHLIAFCVLEMYPLVKAKFGMHGLFFGLSIWCLSTGIIVYTFVPETKNRSLEEIQHNLKNYKVFNRKPKSIVISTTKENENTISTNL